NTASDVTNRNSIGTVPDFNHALEQSRQAQTATPTGNGTQNADGDGKSAKPPTEQTKPKDTESNQKYLARSEQYDLTKLPSPKSLKTMCAATSAMDSIDAQRSPNDPRKISAEQIRQGKFTDKIDHGKRQYECQTKTADGLVTEKWTCTQDKDEHHCTVRRDTY